MQQAFVMVALQMQQASVMVTGLPVSPRWLLAVLET